MAGGEPNAPVRLLRYPAAELVPSTKI